MVILIFPSAAEHLIVYNELIYDAYNKQKKNLNKQIKMYKILNVYIYLFKEGALTPIIRAITIVNASPARF